jgi:hypothetical protein
MATLTARADAAQKSADATLAMMKQMEAEAKEQASKTTEKPAIKNDDDKKNAQQKPKKPQQSVKSAGKAAQAKVKDPSKDMPVPAASKTLVK